MKLGPGLSFSWKCVPGVTNVKSCIPKATGISSLEVVDGTSLDVGLGSK
jgi:hypothetical protein